MKNAEFIEFIDKVEIFIVARDSFSPLPDEKRKRIYVSKKDFEKILMVCKPAASNKNNNQNKILGTGRKPTREREYGKVVRELRKDGKTIRQIAEYVGISTSTVQKILKASKEQS